MWKFTSLLIALLFFCSFSFAKPILTKGKYLIATLYDGASGTVSPGNDTYQLVYYTDRDEVSATESDYWIIKTVGGLEYTFQNAATLKYIRYNSLAVDRAALVMSDSLMPDKSTSFTLELLTTTNLCYYSIRSMVNTAKVWDRRTQIQGTVYPVGVYSGGGGNIQSYIFYDSEGNSVVDDGKTAVVLPTATQNLGAFKEYVTTLTFDGKMPAVDTSKKEFYITIPEAKMNMFLNFKINFTFTNPAYKLYINNMLVTSGADFRYYASPSKVPIEIRNVTTIISSGTFLLSCIPFVQLYSDAALGSVYDLGRIAVTEPDNVLPAQVLLSNLKLRGDYASRMDKKCFTIKLKDASGEASIDRSYFGLRSDNNWVLDAMSIDPGRMRNRVSTDLWNEFSTRPYYAASEPKMINGTHGQFVEVFVNDSYNGLYCMTEKVDRKQLGLRKLKYSADSTTVTQRGALYKADNWSIGTHLGNAITWGTNIMPAYDNKVETWTAFVVKYPDLGDGEPVEWKPAFDAATVPYWKTSDAIFTANVATTFDLPVFVDYYLLLDIMLATDNHGKNYYLSVYDQTISSKVSLTPWDLDGVWGRRWNGSANLTYANQSLETYITYNEPQQNNLYLRMLKANTEGFNDKLKARYKELRGTYFTLNSLMARFNKYNALFKVSGAAAREKTRWSIGEINTEMTFLSTWITARLSFLDKQYLGGPYTDVKDVTLGNVRFAPNPVIDEMTIYDTNEGDKIQIITLQGAVLMQTISKGGNAVVNMNGYNAGVYLIKVGKNISKVIKQ